LATTVFSEANAAAHGNHLFSVHPIALTTIPQYTAGGWQARNTNRAQGNIMGTTKENLIDRIAEHTGAAQKLVKTVLGQLFKEVIAELAQGNRIELRGFGVFEPKTTPSRTARNPRTSQKIQVPAKRRVAFKPGRLLKQQLNGHSAKAHAIDEANPLMR
jgi:nucleoid DNA-binding protein